MRNIRRLTNTLNAVVGLADNNEVHEIANQLIRQLEILKQTHPVRGNLISAQGSPFTPLVATAKPRETPLTRLQKSTKELTQTAQYLEANITGVPFDLYSSRVDNLIELAHEVRKLRDPVILGQR